MPRIGDVVGISGLKSRPELNGTRGTIVRQKGERWGVELPGNSGQIALKPTSIWPVEPEDICGDGALPQVRFCFFASF
jgi:hypothetical protein